MRTASDTLVGQHLYGHKADEAGALHAAQERSGWRRRIDVMNSLPD